MIYEEKTLKGQVDNTFSCRVSTCNTKVQRTAQRLGNKESVQKYLGIQLVSLSFPLESFF